MKKLFAIIGLVAMVFATGCTKIETELSGDTLETKVTVSGHARFSTLEKDGTQSEPDIVDKNTVINVYYGVPDKNGEVAFAYKTVQTDIDGFFELELGNEELELEDFSLCTSMIDGVIFNITLCKHYEVEIVKEKMENILSCL